MGALMNKAVVAITAPSLDATKNVSGISSVVRVILGTEGFRFVHFQVGSQDSERKDLAWALSQLAMYVRLPVFLLRNRVDLLHLNTALNPMSIWRDLLIALVARLVGSQVLVHLHGGKYLADECDSGVIRLGIRVLLSLGTGIAVLSDAEVDIVRLRGYSDGVGVSVLTNSIDLSEVPDVEPKGHQGRLRLVFLGRFHESKGLSEIVEAAGILKAHSIPFSITAYGSGPEQESFCGVLAELLGADFSFGGVVFGKAKWDALMSSDVFLLPSRHGEGLPMAMLEAMAVGVCVVVTDLASIASVVKSGENGIIVEKENAAALAAALEMLDADRAAVVRMAGEAKQTVRSRFSAGEYRERVSELYGRLLKKR